MVISVILDLTFKLAFFKKICYNMHIHKGGNIFMEKNYNTATNLQTLSLDQAIEKINAMLSTEISRINVHAYNTFLDIAKGTAKLSGTKTVTIGEGMEISNYENVLNLTHATFYNKHISTIHTPFILTDKYNYALGRNGVYKYFSQDDPTKNNSDVYSYYEFKEDGAYYSKLVTGHAHVLLARKFFKN